MSKRPKKKVILFLVEGDSEREALYYRFSELYDNIDENIEVFFPKIVEPTNDPDNPLEKDETGGDITQRFDVYPGNYDEKVFEFFLRDFFNVQKILPKDVYEVIQLVDMDGAFVDDECVVCGENPTGREQPYYDKDKIITLCPEQKRRRNKRKRTNTLFVMEKTTIKIKQKTVPYSVYFFSSNLDHFLHSSANMGRHEKTEAASAFSDAYTGNTMGFADVFLKDPDAMQGMTYQESWAYITQEHSLVSLERHTNINSLVQKLLDMQQ